MTPQQLVEIHVIKKLCLDSNESIDYLLVPNYEEACQQQGFTLNEDNNDNEYYWEEAVDLDDRDYFDTPKEAWINCALANNINPYFLTPSQNIVVSEWLYNQLLRHGQPVGIYKNLHIWGCPGNGMAIHREYVIEQIALGN